MALHSTAYRVAGVNSGHCQARISTALRALDTVRTVRMEISTGVLTVTTETEPDDGLVSETVEDAGYDFLGRAD
ncbi:heavy-metal-associated domain-containing protein [Streptomyces sp. NPDC014894]|uniref:heavy-metal-associated domain-containing protein n=1 Tax=unclassified Streptomyces TaxID=2593676 RepID=UPI0036FAC6D6